MQTAALSLFPLKTIGRPDPDLAAVRSRAGVEYREVDVRKVLNRCSSPSAPRARSLNPYRGCEFGFTYGYAREHHRFLELGRWQDFERKIFVKRNAAASLERTLRSTNLAGQPIVIGTASDPYQPAERHYRVTRSVLEVLDKTRGLDISITTRSPLILRDLSLLARLDRKHSVTVNIAIPTLDARVAKRLEPGGPSPEARLRTLQALSAESIPTQVFCTPVMPGINATETQLRPIFEAAFECEAQDVVGNPLFLRPASRKHFWPWLESEFPELVKRYQALYGNHEALSTSQKERLLGPFRALRLSYGFPRRAAGRG